MKDTIVPVSFETFETKRFNTFEKKLVKYLQQLAPIKTDKLNPTNKLVKL